MDAVILTHNIDQPFISQLERKNEGIKFQRIDADVTDALKSKTSKKAEKEMEEQTYAGYDEDVFHARYGHECLRR